MFEYSPLIAYTIALSVAAAIPGPGMVALVARSVSGGALCGFSMLFGLIIGDLIFLSFAVFGLALFANHFSALFVVVKWCASLYLIYLAWQFWTTKYEPVAIAGEIKKKVLISAWISGLTITLGNPKTIGFYLAIVPLVINLTTVSLRTWGLLLVPLTIFILLLVGAVFIFGALRMRRLLSNQGAQEKLFRGAALIMLIAALTMMFKN
jgi:threonine/homoserine/homoserine lactone efflux protein